MLWPIQAGGTWSKNLGIINVKSEHGLGLKRQNGCLYLLSPYGNSEGVTNRPYTLRVGKLPKVYVFFGFLYIFFVFFCQNEFFFCLL